LGPKKIPKGPVSFKGFNCLFQCPWQPINLARFQLVRVYLLHPHPKRKNLSFLRGKVSNIINKGLIKGTTIVGICFDSTLTEDSETA